MREQIEIDVGNLETDQLTGNIHTHLSLFNIYSLNSEIDDDYPAEFRVFNRWSSHEFYKSITKSDETKVLFVEYRSSTTEVRVYIHHG
jgi:hypothetical protein